MAAIYNVLKELYMAEQYITDNILVGNAEIPARRTPQGLEWIFPGGMRTKVRAEAVAYAEKLNKLITANLLPFKRRLFHV